MAKCAGTRKTWVKPGRKTICPVCSKSIAQIGGHPDRPIPSH